jgi:N-acyl-D-amino-acid deacylase
LDVVITGGTVVDGTGAPRFKADVGIVSGKMVKVSRSIDERAEKRIDASGMIVSPGFIDIHTHSDFTLLLNTRAESFVRQGVTTELLGACGRTCAPVNEERVELLAKDLVGYNPIVKIRWRSLDEYLRELERLRVAHNVAAMVGHNAVRIAAIGYEDRAPSDTEMGEMKRLVDESMRDGAFALSTGLAYPPGSSATTEEVIELAKVAAAQGGFYYSHLRGTDGDFLAGVDEALRIGREAGIPVHMAHLCGFFGMNDETRKAIRTIDEARRNGMDVTCDLYPYTMGSSPFMSFFPQSMFEKGDKQLVREMRDPDSRRKLVDEILGSPVGSFWLSRPETLERIRLYDCRAHPELKRKNLLEIGEELHLPALEAGLMLLADEGDGMHSVGLICEWQKLEDNHMVFETEFHMVGSDGAALAPYGELGSFKFHPRSYGTFPRVIGTYVREEGVLSLEEAVRKMTTFPAKRLGMADRGFIGAGAWADIVVFDYERISALSTFEEPDLYPAGVEYVLVNGEMVVEHGEHTGKLAGKVLRKPSLRSPS